MFPSITMTAATLLGVLGWIIKENGGSTDPLITSPVKVSSMNRSFLFLQCVFSTAAVWGGSGDRLSDWSRSRRKDGPHIKLSSPNYLSPSLSLQSSVPSPLPRSTPNMAQFSGLLSICLRSSRRLTMHPHAELEPSSLALVS